MNAERFGDSPERAVDRPDLRSPRCQTGGDQVRIGQPDSFRGQAPRFDHQTHIGEADGMNLVEVAEIDQCVSAVRQIAAGQFRYDEGVDAELVGIDEALQFRFEAATAKQFDPDGSVGEDHGLFTVKPGEACARS